MIVLRRATEDEMLLAFLRGELRSRRFSGELKAALLSLGLTERIITAGDLRSAEENEHRKAVMAAFRGYPDREVFAEYPQGAAWYHVRFEERDLERIRYISYCYWDELSNGTSSPLVGAETVKKGRTVCEVPNDNFLDAAKALAAGRTFDPIILITQDDAYILLEGHVRATAYAMAPEYFNGAYGYVAYRKR